MRLNLLLFTVLSKSVKKERVKSNSKLISLDEADIEKMLKIHETHSFRACGPEWTGYGDLGFPDRKKD